MYCGVAENRIFGLFLPLTQLSSEQRMSKKKSDYKILQEDEMEPITIKQYECNAQVNDSKWSQMIK